MTIPNTTFLIGLDLGTSVIKGLVMDLSGRVIATAEAPTHYLHPHPGWVESEPEEHLHNVFAVIRQLAGAVPGPIRALAAAAASGNVLLTDAAGTPLTRIVNWMDRRADGERPGALHTLTPDVLRQVTGWPCLDSFPLANLAWLKENRPTVFERAGRVCMDTDWLQFQLTGSWVMDHSTATTSHLQDQLGGIYHKPFLDLLKIPQSKLSRLAPSGTSVGTVTPAAAEATGLSPETVVVTGCFDHPAAARAVGALDPGHLMLSCGTSWVGFLPEMDRQKIIDAELLCDPFLSSRGGPWAGMLSVPYIGRTIDDYVREIIARGEKDPYAVFAETAATADEGASGLSIDLREPVHEVADSRANISRAVMEGAARLLGAKLTTLQHHGFEFKTAVMVGGPSRIPLWSSVIESITGLTLSSGTAYSGARGAAMLAGIGAGVYKDERDALEKMQPERES